MTQAIVGVSVLVIVCLVSIAGTIKYSENFSYNKPFWKVGVFLLFFIGCYFCFVVLGSAAFALTWLASELQKIIVWIGEALLYPLHWIINLF